MAPWEGYSLQGVDKEKVGPLLASVAYGQRGTRDIPGLNASRNSELSAVAMPKEQQVTIGVPVSAQ